MTPLIIENDGQDIAASNYWLTDQAFRGHILLSINAGAFRLLLPRALRSAISEMATAREVVVSRGPWPDMGRDVAIELMFEDGTDAPYALHFGVEQIDRLPPADDDRREDRVFSLWVEGPRKVLQLPARFRLVERIPFMRPWR